MITHQCPEPGTSTHGERSGGTSVKGEESKKCAE